jgi:3-deoxy-D-manno-octulosonic-acid transferase
VAKTSTGYWVYRAFSRVYPAAIKLVAGAGHQKAKAWVDGRDNELWQQLERGRSTLPGRVAWFHAASLGEFEQARPVIEAFKEQYPTWGIVLTFFSPSGYLIRKNYAGADVVTYLPSDSPENSVRFLNVVRPDLALFVKYEFWPFYLLELRDRGIPAISFSAIFRPNQIFFKPWGRFMRLVLSSFSLIYTQDEASARLLRRIQMPHTEVAGDTRFDRVIQIAESVGKLPLINTFKGDGKVLVLGSAWPMDVKVVLEAVLALPQAIRPKVIVAPHELTPDHLAELDNWPGYQSLRYSAALPETATAANLMIIDNIGMLSSIYKYADIAWVGGAYGSGLHNILEAAVYSVPVLFGKPKFRKFKEATDLLRQGGAFSCGTVAQATSQLVSLLTDKVACKAAGEAASAYCQKHAGATQIVMSGLHRVIGVRQIADQ